MTEQASSQHPDTTGYPPAAPVPTTGYPPAAPVPTTGTPTAGHPPTTTAERVLEGQVAVVTGAGQGVGAGIAEALAGAGAAVVVATRRGANGEPVAESIRATGNQAVFVRCDVTDADDVQAAVDHAVERFGGLDVMVNNAVSRPGSPRPVQHTDDRVIAAQIATSTTAVYHCARAGLAHLRKRPGTMILLTSPAGIEGSANLPVYATVKAAQRGILKSLAREWGPLGVRVNAIAPVARTPAMDAAVADNPELGERVVARTPLGRLGDAAADIGPVAVFLASDQSRYMTGQTLVADGGGFLGL